MEMDRATTSKDTNIPSTNSLSGTIVASGVAFGDRRSMVGVAGVALVGVPSTSGDGADVEETAIGVKAGIAGAGAGIGDEGEAEAAVATMATTALSSSSQSDCATSEFHRGRLSVADREAGDKSPALCCSVGEVDRARFLLFICGLGVRSLGAAGWLE
jgi:hypothetical protein